MLFKYTLANGTTVLVDADPEVIEYLEESDREMENQERRERYHSPYHLEALEYEGPEYADMDTPEETIIRDEEREHLNELLEIITETQLRRLVMQADGMTLREIAEEEGVDLSSVRDSLELAKKKIKENF